MIFQMPFRLEPFPWRTPFTNPKHFFCGSRPVFTQLDLVVSWAKGTWYTPQHLTKTIDVSSRHLNFLDLGESSRCQ